MSNIFGNIRKGSRNPAFLTPADKVAASADTKSRNHYGRMHEGIQGTLESTTRTLRLLNETESMGSGTVQDLEHQRERLQNVDRMLDQTKEMSERTQDQLNSIEAGFLGKVKNYFKKDRALFHDFDHTKSSSSLDIRKLFSSTPNLSNIGKSSEHLQDPKAMWKIKGLKEEALVAMDDEINENLSLMTNSLSNLKLQGVAMNNEIMEQNTRLDSMTEKMEYINHLIRDQDKQAHNILK